MSKLLAWFKFHIELWRTMRAYARWDAVVSAADDKSPWALLGETRLVGRNPPRACHSVLGDFGGPIHSIYFT